ncbi:hypothetical protein JVT61DRAFT_195 [Boletus reticuloceps]|uniref:Uncharacterized protein n=1 Tax=Boletus reticuloceps TaxID=495285 RepID=A0A8I2Z2G8_9AGAM|nr:hypothetical protein JVT61DRAFT_195 [Boletus reticuloceps]
MVTTPPTSNPDSPLNGPVDADNGIPRRPKRTHLQFSLPSEGTAPQVAWDPRKKVKTVYTTVGLCAVAWTLFIDGCMQVSARRSREVEDLFSRRMLQLARASRGAFAAQLKYRRLRLQEIQVMHTIAVDERDEAETRLRTADAQIGEVRHILHTNGTALGDSGIVPSSAGHDSDSESSHVGQAKETAYKSPTPSSDSDHDI